MGLGCKMGELHGVTYTPYCPVVDFLAARSSPTGISEDRDRIPDILVVVASRVGLSVFIGFCYSNTRKLQATMSLEILCTVILCT